VFMIPTYAFVGSLLCAILIGITKTVLAGGHPVPVVPPPPSLAGAAVTSVSLWAAAASVFERLHRHDGRRGGEQRCVRAFREPAVRYAQRTLTVIIALLAVLLAGIAYL